MDLIHFNPFYVFEVRKSIVDINTDSASIGDLENSGQSLVQI